MRDSKEIIKLIKRRREELNMSQRELARLTNLNNSTISRYEKFERDFPINDAPIFAKALNLNLNSLLGVEDKLSTQTFSLSKDEQDLLDNYNNSNTEGKTIILDTSKNISKAYPFVSREEMIEYIAVMPRAAWGGSKNVYDMTDEELEKEYYEIKEAEEND